MNQGHNKTAYLREVGEEGALRAEFNTRGLLKQQHSTLSIQHSTGGREFWNGLAEILLPNLQ